MSKPIAARNTIVVKPLKLQDINQGIFVAATEKEKNALVGSVVEVGPIGKDTELPFEKPISVGDKLLYRQYGSTNFIIGGSEYAFVGVADIVGRIEE